MEILASGAGGARVRTRAATRLGWLAAVLAVYLMPSPLSVSAADVPLETAVMATYIVKFGPFVDWPPAAFASPAAPLNICVAGDALGGAIDEAAAGQKVGEHPIAVRHITSVPADLPCHILFVSGSPSVVAAALRAVAEAPILTVTNEPDGSAATGTINFVLQNNHVRFEIDNARALHKGLRLSSQLLALAINVGQR